MKDNLKGRCLFWRIGKKFGYGVVRGYTSDGLLIFGNPDLQDTIFVPSKNVSEHYIDYEHKKPLQLALFS